MLVNEHEPTGILQLALNSDQVELPSNRDKSRVVQFASGHVVTQLGVDKNFIK